MAGEFFLLCSIRLDGPLEAEIINTIQSEKSRLAAFFPGHLPRPGRESAENFHHVECSEDGTGGRWIYGALLRPTERPANLKPQSLATLLRIPLPTIDRLSAFAQPNRSKTLGHFYCPPNCRPLILASNPPESNRLIDPVNTKNPTEGLNISIISCVRHSRSITL